MKITQSQKAILSFLMVAIALAFAAMSVLMTFPSLTHAATFNRELQIGMSGGDVSALQTFLAADPSIYPQGLVTGYFGFLTKAAVSNFQSRNGISAVGRVGPITLAAINRMGSIGGSSDVSGPVISSISAGVSTSSATVSWATNEETISTLYYSIAPIYMSESPSNANAVSVSGNSIVSANSGLRTSHTVNVRDLQANTKYNFVVHSYDQSGNVSVTWPSSFQTKN